MSNNKHDMTRGSFLSLFAAAPFAGVALADSSNSQSTLNFHLSGDSYRVNTTQQSGGPYTDRLVFAGSGQISGKLQVGQTTTSASVTAEGSFAHYDVSLSPGNNIPLKFTGTWKATDLVSFDFIGLYGTDSAGNFPLAAGVLIMDIVLVRPATTLIPLTRVPSRLMLVSTLGTGTGSLLHQPAGFSPISGSPDGITLLAPNDPVNGFFFVPIPVASTAPDSGEAHTSVVFSTLNENRNEPTNGSVQGNG